MTDINLLSTLFSCAGRFWLLPFLLFFNGIISAQSLPISQSKSESIGKEHFAVRDNLKIYLWEKYQKNFEKDFASTGKIILLVHGATWSGRPNFDLQIRDYSLMDFLARNGYDVWAIDIHGYGHSGKSDQDWSDTESASRDIGAAVDYITKHRNAEKISILGWSWGTQTSGLYVMRQPEKVSKLILYAPLWKGKPEWKNLPLPTQQYRSNTEAGAREDFIEGQYEGDVVEKYVKEALAADPKSPNGVKMDVLRKLPLIKPEKITIPTLVIRPEKDYAPETEILEFFGKLGTNYKSYVALPDGGHTIILEKNHNKFQSSILNFLNQ